MLLGNEQLALLALGAICPLAGYALNHVAPWASEQVKGVVQVVLAALVGVAYKLIASGGFAWTPHTRELLLTAVFGALSAHHLLWKPAGWSAALGGGRNRGAAR